MIFIAWFVWGFLAIRLLVAFFNLAGRQWLRNGQPVKTPLVSVLIPARNEETNIGGILSQLSNHDYPHMEVIVYDDLSTDNTFGIASEFAVRDSRFRVIRGKELPAGWLGKNHGCHNLAMAAKGDYFLFLDADVKVGKGLIKNGLHQMEKNRLSLLSIFPMQQMHSLAEWLTVPLMNWILVGLLPLAMVRLSKRPSLSAANGQFMLFDARIYRNELFHKTLRSVNVEDIAISRLMKTKGYNIQTLLGSRAIQCRMYTDWADAVKGFSRNVFYFFGGSKLVAFFFGLITTFGFLAVWMAQGTAFSLFFLAMSLLLRIIISVASRQHVLKNIILSPLQQFAFLYVIVFAANQQSRRQTQWKGRNIDQ